MTYLTDECRPHTHFSQESHTGFLRENSGVELRHVVAKITSAIWRVGSVLGCSTQSAFLWQCDLKKNQFRGTTPRIIWCNLILASHCISVFDACVFCAGKRLYNWEREKRKRLAGWHLKVLSVPLLIGHTGCLEDKHPPNHCSLTGIGIPFPGGDLMACLGEILVWLAPLMFYTKISRFNLLDLFKYMTIKKRFSKGAWPFWKISEMYQMISHFQSSFT